MASGDTLSARERADIERAVRIAEQLSGLSFSVYVGPAEAPARAYAEGLHAELVAPARSVLVMVDPGQRQLEIVTGTEARRFLHDTDCQLVVLAMRSAFADGDLVGGLVSGVQQLGDHARHPRTVHTDEP
ncbi:protein of unknown function [Actinopolymorpha cephalotaxi]|uniref:Membrane protein YgcG n=1 Tax=Actinopolymorpha cephalotaxi TaxID=504797 RepID=A0A1I2SG52_9ACTN|nr:DUF5130 family protein [Actinopolymorpha cephalotaxi]NYH83959.1 putative membrane protein YgcG [Actinopolymorpha cephalotaxi]SFG51825.1 protein of unknown function [Actinopolymorpha cephalotaxi]